MSSRGRWATLLFAIVPTTGLASSCGDVRSDLIVGTLPAVGCSRDDECSPDVPRCDLETQRCVQCLDRSDCGQGQSCTLPAGVCVQSCGANSVCPAPEPVCDPVSGLCRGCTADLECSHNTPFCDRTSGRCLECRSSDDCGDFELPYCDTRAGRCVECTESGHCDADGEECSTVLGECAIPCPLGTGCPGDDPVCDRSIGFCVECVIDADCGPGRICRGSDCRRAVDGEQQMSGEH